MWEQRPPNTEKILKQKNKTAKANAFAVCFYTPEYAAQPASTGNTTPVIALADLSSHKKSVAPISSSPSTKRFVGVPLKIFWLRAVGVPSSPKSSALFCADTKNPGAMALQRIPVPAKWVASHWVKFEIPALAAEYAGI